jgi:hypothetical protein
MTFLRIVIPLWLFLTMIFFGKPVPTSPDRAPDPHPEEHREAMHPEGEAPLEKTR